MNENLHIRDELVAYIRKYYPQYEHPECLLILSHDHETDSINWSLPHFIASKPLHDNIKARFGSLSPKTLNEVREVSEAAYRLLTDDMKEILK